MFTVIVPAFPSRHTAGDSIRCAEQRPHYDRLGAVVNQGYRLQSVTNISATNWLDVGGEVVATGATASQTNSVPANRRNSSGCDCPRDPFAVATSGTGAGIAFH